MLIEFTNSQFGTFLVFHRIFVSESVLLKRNVNREVKRTKSKKIYSTQLSCVCQLSSVKRRKNLEEYNTRISVAGQFLSIDF